MLRRLLITGVLVFGLSGRAMAQVTSGIANHIKFGASLPTTCNPATGDVFFRTTSSIGPYYCSSANTWTSLVVTGIGTLNSYTQAGLPVAGTVGRLARVSNVARGIWMDQGSQWFPTNGGVANVLEFGAVGDGVADDTTSIQAAFDTIRPVFFPCGTYKVTAPLTFNAGFYGADWRAVAPSLSPLTCTNITYSGSGSALTAGVQLYGARIGNFALTIAAAATATVGIDFKYGGNNNVLENIYVTSSATVNQSIIFRGQNPDTLAANAHQHRNVFRHIFTNGSKTGLRGGDDLTNGEFNANEIEDFQESNTQFGIELNGSGTTIISPILTTTGIRFFGNGSNNSIIGGYVESTLATAVTINSTNGNGMIFAAYGVPTLTLAKITNTSTNSFRVDTDSITFPNTSIIRWLNSNSQTWGIQKSTNDLSIKYTSGTDASTGTTAMLFQGSNGNVSITNSLQLGGTSAANFAIAPVTVAGGWGAKFPSAADTNGQAWGIEQITELTTIAAAATTDTAIQIPANAVVLSVNVRVVTVIPTAATFTVTGTTTGTAFQTGTNVSTVAGTTDVGTKSCPYLNTAAQTIRITPNLTPAAATGQVRTTIVYGKVTVATS